MNPRRATGEHRGMAKMQFRAAPVTPVKAPRQRRIGSPKAAAASTLSGALPFDESSWHLREGLDMKEAGTEEFPTTPGPLWSDSKPRGGA